MTRWMTLLLVCVALTGCKKKIPWGEKKATEMTVGPYKIAIPPGWRDIAELQDDDIKSKMAAGVVAMMPEKLGSHGFQANIVFTWAALEAGEIPTCEVFADAVAKQFGGKASKVESLQIESDRACRWAIAKENAVGIQAVRFQMDQHHELVLQCLRASDDEASLDQVCKQIQTTLKFP